MSEGTSKGVGHTTNSQTTRNRKKIVKICNVQQFFCHNKLVKLHSYVFTWIFFNSKLCLNFANVSLIGGLCWSHTQASKPLVIVKNTLGLPKFTIVMQCHANKHAFRGFILDAVIKIWLR
jgi:hypothetical protein